METRIVLYIFLTFSQQIDASAEPRQLFYRQYLRKIFILAYSSRITISVKNNNKRKPAFARMNGPKINKLFTERRYLPTYY